MQPLLHMKDVFAGYGQAADRQRSFQAGFDDFVVKPVDPTRLTQILTDRTANFQW